MVKGYRATPRQKAAGSSNIRKANVMRVGVRGRRYKPRRPKL